MNGTLSDDFAPVEIISAYVLGLSFVQLLGFVLPIIVSFRSTESNCKSAAVALKSIANLLSSYCVVLMGMVLMYRIMLLVIFIGFNIETFLIGICIVLSIICNGLLWNYKRLLKKNIFILIFALLAVACDVVMVLKIKMMYSTYISIALFLQCTCNTFIVFCMNHCAAVIISYKSNLKEASTKKAKMSQMCDLYLPSLKEFVKLTLTLFWPGKSQSTKFLVISSLFLVLLQRIILLLTPLSLKYAIERISSGGTEESLMCAVIFFWFHCFLHYFTYNSTRSGGIVGFVFRLLWLQVEFRMQRIITHNIIHSLLTKSSSDDSKKYHKGSLSSVINRGIESFQKLVKTGMFDVVPIFADLFIAASYFAVVNELSVATVIVIACTCQLVVCIYTSSYRKKFRSIANYFKNSHDAKIVEIIENKLTIKSFCKEFFELKALAKLVVNNAASSYSLWVLTSITNFLESSISSSMMFHGILIFLSRNQIEPGNIVFFLSYSMQLLWSVKNLSNYIVIMQTCWIDFAELFFIYKPSNEVIAENFHQQVKSIEFSNVSYKVGPAILLKDITFKVKSGQYLFIAGHSGSGKTTIINLLLNLLSPSSGKILLNGVILKSKKLQSTSVLQTVKLFHESFKYNICYSELDASDDDIEEAIRASSLENVIDRLPQKCETLLSEPYSLSWGEIQRVGLARCYIRKSQLVVLDEAFRGLDAPTRTSIFNSIRERFKDTIMIVADHNLNFAKSADNIIVLQNGCIVENGTHNDLLKSGKIYSSLWQYGS